MCVAGQRLLNIPEAEGWGDYLQYLLGLGLIQLSGAFIWAYL